MIAEMIPEGIVRRCSRCGKALVGQAYRVDRGQFAMPDGRGDRAVAQLLEEFTTEERCYLCPECYERGGR